MITLGIVSNFIWTLSVLDPYQRTYHSGWTQGNLGSPFSIGPQAIIHNEGIIRAASIKSLCFISTIPVHFIYSTIKVSKYYFVFISLNFMFPGAIPGKGINTENSVIRGSGVARTQTLLFDQCQPQWYLQDPNEAGQAILLCGYLHERKRWSPTNYFLYVFDGVLDHGWYEFQLKYWSFWGGFLQNSSARSCFKGFLMPLTLSYIMQ